MAKMTYEPSSGSYMQPAWAAEPIGPQNMIPGGAQLDPSGFPASDGFTIAVTAAEVASSTATIAVAALKGNIPAGYILHFGGTKYAVLNAAAIEGSVELNANLADDLTGNETATYAGITGKKLVKAGTLVGRTYAERDAGTPFGPYATGDDEVYLLAFDTPDAAINPECELLRHHTLVRDHLLPGWADLPPATQAVIRTQYQCQRAPFEV